MKPTKTHLGRALGRPPFTPICGEGRVSDRADGVVSMRRLRFREGYLFDGATLG